MFQKFELRYIIGTRVYNGFWENKGAIVDTRENANTIPSVSVLWYAVVFGIQNSVVNIVRTVVDFVKFGQNVLKVFSLIERYQTTHIFQNENLRLFLFEVIQNIEKYSASAALIFKTLLFPSRAKRLTRKPSDVEIDFGGFGVVSLRDVFIEFAMWKIRFYSFVDMLAIVTGKNVIVF